MVPAPAAPTSDRLQTVVQRFIEARGGALIAPEPGGGLPVPDARRSNVWTDDGSAGWLVDPVPAQFLAGGGVDGARNRQTLYMKYQGMLSDAVISAAMRFHATAALGGDEKNGDMVFIETSPAVKDDKKAAKLVEMLASDMQPIFNLAAPTMAFNAIGFGDGYARIYAEKGVGVTALLTDELMYPPMVQPFERGGTTVGFQVSTGGKFSEKLSIMQVARMKMPRLLYTPQDRAMEKWLRTSLKADRIEDLPMLPSLVGGSFLAGSEKSYDNLVAALAALLGTRARGSIEEMLVNVNLSGTTKDQRKLISDSVKSILERSHKVFQQVMQSGRVPAGRLFHMMPTFAEKQAVSVQSGFNAGSPGEYNIEDVMLHARFLAGALGVDLSLLGFADQLSGGLGDGGFTRNSIQAAERSRAIRTAMTACFDHVLSVHALLKYGVDFYGKPKPWAISYYSGISAMETEQQKTRAERQQGAAVIVQTLEQLRSMGLDEPAMVSFLKTEMALDEADAKMYARALKNAKPPQDAGGGGEFGDGGGGGGFGAPGGAPGAVEEDPPEGQKPPPGSDDAAG